MVTSLPKSKTSKSSSTSTPASSSSNSPLNQIVKLETTLLSDKYDPNPLLPLIALARNESAEIVHKAVWALHRVFIKLINDGRIGGLNGDLADRTAGSSGVDGDDIERELEEGGEEREVKAWVRERLLEYVEILGGLVRDAEPALRTSSVPLLFSLLPPLSISVSPTNSPLIHIPYFRLLLHYLIFPYTSLRGAKPKSSKGWKTIAANQVEEDEGFLPPDVAKIVVDDFWAKYDDIRWAFFKEAANLILSQTTVLPHPQNLLSQLLPLVNLPKLPEDLNTFYIPSFSTPPTSSSSQTVKKLKKTKKGKSKGGEVDALPDWMKEYESSGSESETETQPGGGGKPKRKRISQMSVHASVYSVQSQTTVYTTLWENVLSSVPLDEVSTRKILVGLHGESGILGHFKPERRLRIADWLGSLVDGGGAMAMLAMNGLFVLITQYNFEYPRFYERLYGLLDRNVMHVKYRARFFRLLDTFLSSSLISSSLIASFIKRLSRLSLTAPPSGTILILPFIYNLFKRHPGCMIMLQRQPTSIVAALTEEDQKLVDPYDESEVSPLKTKAIESSCWELAALQKHYLAPIATLAKIFGEVFTKPEFNMEDFLDHGYGTLFDTESNRRIKNPPALSMTLETATEGEIVPFPSKEVERQDGGDTVSQLWAF
ncbi:hypothetical protein CI109_106356 [Kwoniella shandongensis]|uniref:Uncharacterized protein n=1 Tax=Kwoniella shandongensis TaxID=1734106 RepID=A0A5M6BSF5_9TREE|nr:uncharacterized protein CI109_005939 [Kwoniella shandongensis]KAA5525776.1 hypothetical protein CI109_005939 [Kwoniella shandongensis]